MGILKRIKDVLSANINTLVDRVEDPIKMSEEYIRKLNDDLASVKAKTVSVMAEEKRAKRELKVCQDNIKECQKLAENAVKKGKDDAARKALSEKHKFEQKEVELQNIYNTAKEASDNIQALEKKLVDDIQTLENRRAVIASKVNIARTKDSINEVASAINSSKASLNAFQRMEAKADRMLDKADALAELNTAENTDEFEKLKRELDASEFSVDDELAELKEKYNK